MKKCYALLVCALLCVLLCFPAFADMGGPQMIGYTVVTQAETPYYDWEWNDRTDESVFKQVGTIPAGTQLHISYESSENGVMYGHFSDEEADVDGYVRLADVQAPDREPYPKEKGYKQSTAVRLRVTEPKGVALRSGPSETYPVVTTIPLGTELTCDTLDNTDYESGGWMYLTYGGAGGWAHCWLYDGAACPVAELLPKGLSVKGVAVKKNAVLLDHSGNAVVSVPKGETLTVDAFNREPYTLFFWTSYNGKKGYFAVDSDGNDNTIAASVSDYADNNLTYTTLTLEKLYANPDDMLPSGVLRFKANETIKWQYQYYAEPLPEYRGGVEWYYVEKDGQSGWISPDGRTLAQRTSENSPIPSLRSSSAGPHDTGENFTLPERTTETTTVLEEYVPEMPTDAPTESRTAPENTFPQFEETEEPEETSTTRAASDTSVRPAKPVMIILICAAGAAVLSLTAFVTMRLIRKNKD